MKRIGMIGGDLRNKYLADMCKKVGYDVFTYGLYEDESETLESLLMKSECIICGTPFSRDNLTIQAPFAKKQMEHILISGVLKNWKSPTIIKTVFKKLCKDANIHPAKVYWFKLKSTVCRFFNANTK